MAPQFTDDDIGKDVVNANGDQIGIVGNVEHGTAYVEPDPGITDSIKATLGWGSTDEDAYPLQEEAIARVTDDEIRLERDLEGAGTQSGTETGMGTTGAGGTTDTGTDTGSPTGLNDDNDEGLMSDDDDDGLIGDDNDEGHRSDEGRRRDDDDDSLIGDDNDDDGLMSDDDDDDGLIGDDNDDDRKTR